MGIDMRNGFLPREKRLRRRRRTGVDGAVGASDDAAATTQADAMVRTEVATGSAATQATTQAVAAHRTKRRSQLMFMFAAAVVVLLTAYALALPAVTMEGAGVDAAGDTLSELVEDSGVAASAGTGAKSVSAADEASAAGVGASSEADVSTPAAAASRVSGVSNASAADAASTADSSDVSASATAESGKGNAAVGSGAEGLDVAGAQNAQGEKTDAQGSQDDEDESDLSSLSLDDEIVVQSSESTNDGDGSTTTSDPSILDNLSLVQNGNDWVYIDDEVNEDRSSFNKWQIVSGGYAGNQAANKTSVLADDNVRVQKNVIPTNVENEFLVYLSIDTKQLFSNFFASAEYKATTSNNYHDSDLGTIVIAEGMTGNQNVQVSGDRSAGYKNSATFTFVSSTGELLADNIILYWSQANNVTFYLELNDNGTTKYVLTGLSVKSGEPETIMLSKEAEQLIMSNVAQMANLNLVTDVMGKYIEYLGVVDDRYAKALSYDDKTQTLTWVPQVKTNPEIDKVKTNESKTVTWTDRDGKSHTETVYTYNSWALNVAELVYKVRLCTEKADFQSAANNMHSAVEDSCSYEVNKLATLTYNDTSTVNFPQPYVRGLLYNLPIKKVDEKGSPLADATFKLTGAVSGEGESALQASPVTGTDSATSDEYGLMKFTGLVGLDGKYSGVFQLSETSAPAGYTPLSGPITIDLGNYTSLGDAYFVTDGRNMLRKATIDGSESASVEIRNTKAGYRLPNTGGPGTTMLTVGGLLVLATCLLYRCHIQIRRRREDG